MPPSKSKHHTGTGQSGGAAPAGPATATGGGSGAATAAVSINKKGGAPTIESLGERVFLTSPRMFSFSHRCATSVRHPFVPSAVTTLTAEAEQRSAASKKGGGMSTTAKAERMSEYFADSTEEDKWKAVAKMLDSVLFEKDISQRRQLAIENATLRRALETWWCKAGGTPTRGITEESYKHIHNLVYRDLLNVNDVCMHGIITKSISHDWQWDSAGKGEVDFGRWYMSLLEIADNWVASCDGEQYGQFLVGLGQRVLPSSSSGASHTVMGGPRIMSPNAVSSSAQLQSSSEFAALDDGRRGGGGGDLVDMLHRNARLYRSHKLIQKHWTSRHTVIYSSIPEASH